MNSISVIIICFNEAHHIKKCLDSAKFADEIIVLDSGSTDGTRDIAKTYTAKVFESEWLGFGPQKNKALSLASCDWVLSLDADEAVSPALIDEIKQLRGEKSAYAIPRQSSYLGKMIRFGDWGNDKVLRLFRRDSAQFTDDSVHETLKVEGEIGELTQKMTHDAFETLEQVLHKLNVYSSLGAKNKIEQGNSGGLFKAITHGLWTFLRGYVFRLGFLDGKQGFMLAVSNAEGCYYRYCKISLGKISSS